MRLNRIKKAGAGGKLFKLIALTFIFSILTNLSYFGVSNAKSVIRNGVTCSKSNLISKVGNKTYRCTNNPYITPEKKTWTLKQCVDAIRLRNDAIKKYDEFEVLAKLAGEEGIKALNDLQKSISSLEDDMQNKLCKRGV